MKEFFPGVPKIQYEGPDSKNPLAFKHYHADELVGRKTMRDHLRFAVCYWHTFKGTGGDQFGLGTMVRSWNASSDPMAVAEMTMQAAFEFFSKLGVGFWCFHDRDISPEASPEEGGLAETNRRLDKIVTLAKQLQVDRGVKCLWNTANLFSHPRYMAGAGTSPSPQVFAYAAAQVKKAIEIAAEIGALGYVFWGGREGYDTLLNTDMKRELDQLAAFLHMAVNYARKIGFKGKFYIEPKPKEPTKHQYDFDCAACHAFLQKYGLDKYFTFNIEVNHATLAGHDVQHEIEYAAANGMLGSIDANRGDTLLGWDTDQFQTDIYGATLMMYSILRAGGLGVGGLNFDAKMRRQSTDPIDLFHGHIGSMDAFARGLKAAQRMIDDGVFTKFVNQRYAGWNEPVGQRILSRHATLEDMEQMALASGEPEVQSGRQEMLENMLNHYIR